ncbi:nuclear transcription factor Y subunit C-2 [Arachis duranensis]|uniref:Nuclear transcription factor Y subunit C-2 n=1 Tax=Arachis duranensis TaxID=130453 RepID=A0A6P4D3C3_ARADU|nr:nuclear transcription factor Y subunit C-2 [Arachis duranensis]
MDKKESDQSATRGTSTPSHTKVVAGPSVPSPLLRDHQHSHHYIHYHHLQQEEEFHQKLHNFWDNQYREIEQAADFRIHSLPLARIKKIMKADENVKMISAEAPIIFSKACEMFIMELTMRAWNNAEENKRRTLQKNDIAAAVTKTEVFDFLVDVVPRDETVDLGLYAGIRRGGGNNNIVPCYYYVPPQHVMGPPPYGPPRVPMVGRHVPNQDNINEQQNSENTTHAMCPKEQNHSSDSDE